MSRRNNWERTWRLGRFEFEIEWSAKAHYYTVALTIHTPQRILRKWQREDMKRREREAVIHEGYITEVSERPPFMIGD